MLEPVGQVKAGADLPLPKLLLGIDASQSQFRADRTEDSQGYFIALHYLPPVRTGPLKSVTFTQGAGGSSSRAGNGVATGAT